jgi:hypothetical protein
MATAGVDCIGANADTTANTITLSFTNNIGKPINPGNLELTYGSALLATGACVAQDSAGTALSGPVAEEGVFLLECPGVTWPAGKEKGDKLKLSFTFEYTAEGVGEMPHLASGTATTTAR